jgi:hypothetical protein
MLQSFHKKQPSKYRQINVPCALSKKAKTTTDQSQKQKNATEQSSKEKIQVRMSSPKPKTNVFVPATFHNKKYNVNRSH